MSISRNLRVLVIEDNPEMVKTYSDAITILRDDFDVEKPVIAGGYDQAVSQISRSFPFHLVILDIKLPQTAGGDADAFGGSGLELIESLEARHDYPIPALLLLTGEPKRIHTYSGLSDRLAKGFFYRRVEHKGRDVVEVIREALEAAQRYMDFGISVVDARQTPRPPLSPREFDLLRRFGLNEKNYAGLELRWWTSEQKGPNPDDWAKVLVGRFLMRGHDLKSRPFFFKLESKVNGLGSSKGSTILGALTDHAQPMGHLECDHRSLLVTGQATGPDRGDPFSLSDFLARPPSEVLRHLDRVAKDIAEGVRFGDPYPEPHPAKDLFWRFHWDQLETYDKSWKEKIGAEADLTPSNVLRRLGEDTAMRWVQWQACLHGDLHLGNVALGMDDDQVRAKVFDPGSMEAGPCGRDLAALEVSLVLHQLCPEPGIAAFCMPLFDGTATELSEPAGELPPIVLNTARLLNRIRAHALKTTDTSEHRVLLLDYALIQLGSLAYASSASGNKVKRADDAIALYRALARWNLRTQPEGSGRLHQNA